MNWKSIIAASNYPPGESGMQSELNIDCKCESGHVWSEPGYRELGGTFLVNEEPECSECGKPGEPYQK